MSYSEIKAENKKSKKEAALLETEYEDHLINSKRKHRKGGANRKKVEIEAPKEYTYDNEINAIEVDQTQLLAENRKRVVVLKPKKK